MKRIVTHQETIKSAIDSGDLLCSTNTNNSNQRKKRSLPQSIQLCPINPNYSLPPKTVYESNSDLMNVGSIKTICNMDEKLFRSTPGFGQYCYRYGRPGCCASYSLGNYVASIRNRTSCQDITSEDVTFVKKLFQDCSSLYFSGDLQECLKNQKQNCSEICTRYHKELGDMFTYIVNRNYMRSTDVLKNTMVLTPIWYEIFLEDVYERHLKNDFPEENGVKLVAFDFFNLKFDEFNRKLLADAVFPALGLILIAIILMIYTHSLLVMLFTVFSIISSIIISYFFYHFVFRLKFFPFLNITTFIFLVGIGADDAFVFTDVWGQAKRAKPHGTIVDWMDYTLKHAALSMLVTSLTTSSAFYANVVSDITAIRLFGIFAGTSIIINYAFMITWFPAGIILLEKWFVKSHVHGSPIEQDISLGNMSQDVGKSCPDNPASNSSQENVATECVDKPSQTLASGSGDLNQQTSNPLSGVWKYCDILRSKCSQFMTNLFGCWIPKVLSFYPLWLVALSALGIGMLCAVTVSPGLQRPKSSDFQVFSSSHPLEQYELKYKDKFRADSNKGSNFEVYVLFGVKDEDNGNFLDPDDYGSLTYDTSFNIASSAAQQWLLKLCSHIRNQPFFNKKQDWQCFAETFKQQCSVNQNAKFPYPQDVVLNCIAEQQKHVSNCYYWSAPLLLDKDGNIKVLQVIFPTNISFTTEYEKVDKFSEKIKEFSKNVLDTAPPGLQNGWSISWLRHYALQNALGSSTITSLGVALAISFAVMMLTSLNWLISLYAIVTIICILSTTVGSLVLAGWELNILESIVISVAVGLSVDFTLHYGVAYTTSTDHSRSQKVKYALTHLGPAVTLASITTFIAGKNFILFTNFPSLNYFLFYIKVGVLPILIVKFNVSSVGPLSESVGPSTFVREKHDFQISCFHESIQFLSDEGPTLETLNFTIHIGSTPNILYFDLYLNAAYAAQTIRLFLVLLASI